ncbi:MAG: FMN-dependent NADH-azoreductase [Leptolyngbyaceae bacterium]|nr:FMN-dependent NADH-azoreductase [Leptolyngbyaceae bacterium]
MAHILHIDASPRGDRSVSRTLAKEFIESWKIAHPEDTFTYRDLGHHPVPFITEEWIAAAFTPPDQHTPEMADAIRLSNELVDEFLGVDRYVFSIPMYNFAIPASFKAYVDQILRAGRTFAVDENGYHGLVTGKKAVLILAQGGTYPEGSPASGYDMQTPYLKLILGFMGITDLQFAYADNLMDKGEGREKAIANARAILQDLVAQ